jgi:nucleotide-binding universal stress UspA family protein
MHDILVHVDEPGTSGSKIAVGRSLAGMFDSRLTGLFARSGVSQLDINDHFPSDHASGLSNQARAAFEQECGGQARWVELLRDEPDTLMHEVAFAARYANLAVLGQPEIGGHVPENLVDTVILRSGTPVLVVPNRGRFEKVGRHVVIGWNASRECARAIHDSLPLLQRADKVTLMVMDAPARRRAEVAPQVGIIDHLAANKVQATLDHLAGDGVGIMDVLLSRAADAGADLLVLGASTHGPFSSLGSGIHHVLGHMTLPVLLSH